MVGRADDIQHLEEMPITEPRDGMTAQEIEQMQLDGFSLQTWALVAERLMAYSPAERIRAWNLDCAGDQGIPKDAGFFGATAPRGVQALYTQHVQGYSGAFTGAAAVRWTSQLIEINQDADRRITTIIQDGYSAPGIWRLISDCETGEMALSGIPPSAFRDTGARLPAKAQQSAHDIYCADPTEAQQELLYEPIENAGVYADWWTGIPEDIPTGPIIEITATGNQDYGAAYDTQIEGLLVLDCVGGSHKWVGVIGQVAQDPTGWNVNMSTYRADPPAPDQVLRNATRLYCDFAL